MARPRKDGLDYFPFDVEMDDEFKALEELHGNDGFVWMVKFWQSAYKTKDGLVDLDGIRGVIRRKTSRISSEKQEEIIKDCFELKLLTKKDGKYTSNGIQKRLAKVNEEREKDRNRAKNELSGGKPTEKPTKNLGKRGKEKESKVKKIKENKKNVFTPPTFEEVKNYCAEKGYSKIAQKVFDYYSEANWHDSTEKKVKNWKQKLIAVWFRDENKDPIIPKNEYQQKLVPKEEQATPEDMKAVSETVSSLTKKFSIKGEQ